MTPAELAAEARALIAYSDQRDRETAARLAFGAAQYAAGMAAGAESGARRVHDWYTAERRELAEALGAALARPGRASGVLGRWHVCCKACRLGGHRDGCPRCEDRGHAAFGDPHPDDYPGGPVAGLRTAA